MATGGTVRKEFNGRVVHVFVFIFVVISVVIIISVFSVFKAGSVDLVATKLIEIFIEVSKVIPGRENVVSITVFTFECCCNKLSVGAASSRVTSGGGIDLLTMIWVVVDLSVVVPYRGTAFRVHAIILIHHTKRIGKTSNTEGGKERIDVLISRARTPSGGLSRLDTVERVSYIGTEILSAAHVPVCIATISSASIVVVASSSIFGPPVQHKGLFIYESLHLSNKGIIFFSSLTHNRGI
jgi:hypothetical protein